MISLSAREFYEVEVEKAAGGVNLHRNETESELSNCLDIDTDRSWKVVSIYLDN